MIAVRTAYTFDHLTPLPVLNSPNRTCCQLGYRCLLSTSSISNLLLVSLQGDLSGLMLQSHELGQAHSPESLHSRQGLRQLGKEDSELKPEPRPKQKQQRQERVRPLKLMCSDRRLSGRSPHECQVSLLVQVQRHRPFWRVSNSSSDQE